jgi:hypothetical protein
MAKRTIATKCEVIARDKTGTLVNINYTCPYCHCNTGELILIGTGNINKIDSDFETDQVCGICNKDVIIQCRHSIITSSSHMKNFATWFLYRTQQISFYGIVALLFCFIRYDLTFSTVITEMKRLEVFSDFFFAYMFWSVIAYPIIMVFHVVNCRLLGFRVVYLIVENVVDDFLSLYSLATRVIGALKGRLEFGFVGAINLLLWIANVAFIVWGIMIVF